MQLANSEDEYGLIHKILHWLIAVMIIGLIPVGLGMGTLENSPFKFQVFAMHKSFGLLVLFLGIARLAWRFFSPPPDDLDTHKPWEKALAAGAHFWLYICILGMPLSGWLMSSAGEFPVPFFGIQMPYLIGKDEKLGDLFYEVHEILAYTLLFVLAMHMAGALKHHVIDKDETLQRMTWKKAGLGLTAILVLVAGVSYALSLMNIARDLMPQSEEAVVEQQAAMDLTTPVAQTAAAMPDTTTLPPHGWAIVPGKTKLSFKAMLYGAEFEGIFGDVSGTILFDPADLPSAKANIVIGMQNVATGDADRDTNIKGADWFDSDNHPESRFDSVTFEHAGDDRYVVVGNLTIRGITMPVTIPFTLSLQDKVAVMKGEVELKRTDFGVGGSEQWKDDKTVGQTVKVFVDLTAVQ